MLKIHELPNIQTKQFFVEFFILIIMQVSSVLAIVLHINMNDAGFL